MHELITNYLGYDIYQDDTGLYYAISDQGKISNKFNTYESLLTAINRVVLRHG